MKKRLIFPICAVILGLSACQTQSRYALEQDTDPDTHPDLNHLKPIEPKYEPLSYRGNKPYTVLGKRYFVDTSITSYQEQGIASWYGKKFHGHETSNGERYDMFQLSGAHKTLPLPSYVLVKNLDNDREIIVRINDRGPFHEGRVIDLSYAAARQLGVYQTGTAQVEVTYLPQKPKPKDKAGHLYVQIAAGTNLEELQYIADDLTYDLEVSYRIVERDQLYKLHLGPLANTETAKELIEKIKSKGYPKSFITYDMMK